MNVLLDHCVPKPFGRLLVGHEFRTTFQMGWQKLANGVLLAKAAEQFELFITVDQNVQHQQNLTNLPLAVILLVAPNNQIETLRPLVPEVLRVLGSNITRSMYRIGSVGTTRL